MNNYEIVILILSIALGLFISYPLFGIPFVARYVYRRTLVRKNKKLWSRTCSEPNDYEQVLMFDQGLFWEKEYNQYKKEIHIISENHNLYGEYFDFGFKKCVIIVAGRAESLLYSYYYAKPYKDIGYNVFVFDKRAHGLSDGKYEDCGQRSYIDVINFAKYLHDNYKVEEIILHGICIGSSLSLFAITSPLCPKYITKIIADGMYKTFRDSFKKHMKDDNRSTFIILDEVMLLALFHSKVNLSLNGPYYRIKKLDKPILFIYSSLDKYSTLDVGKKLFSRCKSKEKQFVLFNKGRHSHVRFNNALEYDKAITNFLTN